jgi:hypothetical protein
MDFLKTSSRLRSSRTRNFSAAGRGRLENHSLGRRKSRGWSRFRAARMERICTRSRDSLPDECDPVLHQVLVLTLLRAGTVGLGDLVLGEQVREGPGVEAIGLLLRLGDDPELRGVSEDQALCERLQEHPEPLVGCRGLDHRLEGPLLLEEGSDPGRVSGEEAGDESFTGAFVDNTNGQ